MNPILTLCYYVACGSLEGNLYDKYILNNHCKHFIYKCNGFSYIIYFWLLSHRCLNVNFTWGQSSSISYKKLMFYVLIFTKSVQGYYQNMATQLSSLHYQKSMVIIWIHKAMLFYICYRHSKLPKQCIMVSAVNQRNHYLYNCKSLSKCWR